MVNDEQAYYTMWSEETCYHTVYGHWMTMEVTQVIFRDKYGYTTYMYYGKLYNFQGMFCGYTEYYHEKQGFFELEKAFKKLMPTKKISK